MNLGANEPSTLEFSLLVDAGVARVHRRRALVHDSFCLITPLACGFAFAFSMSFLAVRARRQDLLINLAAAAEKQDQFDVNDTTIFIIDFIAGGVAGAISKTIAAPLERVKLLMQTQDANPLIVSGEYARYTSMWDTASRVYHEQGCLAFWRGNLPNVLRYFPIAAFNFAFKDSIEAMFPKYDPHTQLLQFGMVNLLAGGLAGAMSLTLVFPLDYARTRLAADVGKTQRTFDGLWDCLVKTARANGLAALYKGYGISVVGIFFYRAPYFGLFDTLEGINPYRYQEKAPWTDYVVAVFSAFILAQVVAIIAAAVSYPFDTVRRRLQMESEVPKEQRMYKGAFQCTWHITKTEGVGGLYKGFCANLWRGAATAAILVVYQELTRHVLPHRASEF